MRACRLFRQQPGMANRSFSSVPSQNARTTSSTFPHTSGMTRIPLAARRASSGHEIAPHTSTLTPSSASLCARSCGAVVPRLSVRRLPSSSRSRSTSRTCSATSNTGETRPCQSGTATFMGALRNRFLPSGCSHRSVHAQRVAFPGNPSTSRGLLSVTRGLARSTPHARRQPGED